MSHFPLGVDEVVPWLLDRGLIDSRDIVDDGIRITSRARRNLNLEILRRDRSGLFVKQPDPIAHDSLVSLRREGQFYSLCERHSWADTLREHLPELAAFDFDAGIVVLQLLEGSSSLWAELRRTEDTERQQSALDQLGRGLATLHRTFHPTSSDPRALEDAGLTDLFQSVGKGQDPPGFFSAHRPQPQELRLFGPAHLDLQRNLQSNEALVAGLDRALLSWQAETLIHGDIRSANVLFLEPPATADPKSDPRTPRDRMVLVDWECVQLGDPAWDVAATIADLLHLSIDQLPKVQRWAMSLWRSYDDERGLGLSEHRQFLERVITFLPVRLVQTAFEISSSKRLPLSRSLDLLQIAAKIFRQPKRARRALFEKVLP